MDAKEYHDGTRLLCAELYDREPEPPDWLGGSDAKMLHDAARQLRELRVVVAALYIALGSPGMQDAELIRAARKVLERGPGGGQSGAGPSSA